MKKGILISFEGGEGSGKSVQVKKLAKYLKSLGRKVVVAREPGGTKISEQIRRVILDKENVKMVFECETLLFQAARAQICQEVILPALKKGAIVICDRFRDSSIIYQGMVRNLGVELIEKLNDISTKKTEPAITFLLDVPIEVGLGRRNKADKNDRLDGEEFSFHQKVRQSYLEWAKRNKKRFVVLDGSRDPEAIHQKIVAVLRKKKIVY